MIGIEFRRIARTVGPATKAAERRRANVTTGLLHMLPVILDVTLFKPVQHGFGAFDEAVTRLVHVDTEAVEFDCPQTTADA